MSNETMKLSSDGLESIKKEEGYVEGLYDDQSSYCTYGVGHLVHKINKWQCFLLAAAKDDSSWSAEIGTKYTTVKYLKLTAKNKATFSALKESAVTKAKSIMAKKTYSKEFDALAESQKTTVTTNATAAVNLEAGLLSKSVDDVFKEDVAPFEKTVRDQITAFDLKQKEFDALVSFTFNVGQSNFTSSGLLKKVKENKFRVGDKAQREQAIKDIEEQFMKWTKSGGVELDDLKKRRKKEATAFLEEARKEVNAMP